MINNKNDLKEFIDYEKQIYNKKRASISLFPVLSEMDIIWRFISLLRYEEYHFNTNHKIRYLYFHFRRVVISRITGFNIGINTVDKGFKLNHVGSILMNAKVGKNFSCHINCAFVAGGHDSSYPIIGDNVCVGYGSTIVGGLLLQTE